MPKRSASDSNVTHPHDIPTAIDENPFAEEAHTFIDDPTLEATDSGSGSAGSDTDRSVERFRRPTSSEIYTAVEQVNTEAVDVEEVIRARAEAEATDEES